MANTRDEKNWLEWAVFAVGLLLTLGLVGVLAWDAATRTSSPVQCDVVLESPERQGAVHRIPLQVTNKGGAPAANLHVEVALVRGGEPLETATVDFQFLPRGATRKGAVEFTIDPAEADEIQTRCSGYQTP